MIYDHATFMGFVRHILPISATAASGLPQFWIPARGRNGVVGSPGEDRALTSVGNEPCGPVPPALTGLFGPPYGLP
jgi:hypothetical protein